MTPAPEKVTPIPQEAATGLGVATAATNDRVSRLTMVSRKYDIDGDGQLDEAELAMRNMDKSGKGYLTNEQVYGIMRDHLKDQREIFKFKKVVVGLSVFIVLLTLCNLGTSFAAAYLAKDTTTNESNELTSSETGKPVATQSSHEVVFARQVSNNKSSGCDKSGCRNLQTCVESSSGTVCSTTSFLTIPEDQARNIICSCYHGKKVHIERAWDDGGKTLFPLCPLAPMTVDDDCQCGSTVHGACRYLMLGAGDGMITMVKDADSGTYKLTGDAFTSNEGGRCSAIHDCDEGLDCNGNLEMEDLNLNFKVCKTIE